MPGILPMKVIKMGSSTQTRTAQACDRCRSKKIRCDGYRPSCTQCTTIGFECKTSDKLSRRAFPRGYTETLEERVRILEAEVRELKDLLDEKDETIDMLSRIRSHSPASVLKRSANASRSPTIVAESSEEPQEKDQGTFEVAQLPTLVEGGESGSYFMGTSSGRALVDAFKNKVQRTTLPSADVDSHAFFSAAAKSQVHPIEVTSEAPARMISDQLVNIFFQEWAPLFPILHQPSFLSLYGQYVSCPEAIKDNKSLAQLHLVFGIAARSSNYSLSADVESFEAQWQAALESLLTDSSLVTLQCLALTQIYCLQTADYSRLLKYKGFAAGLAQHLGLHQSQKRFALGTLTTETRKRVFWTLYTLDCFSAAHLGQPLNFFDSDIHCEYPIDADDEYINENEILPSLPGKFTKLSSALALFKLSRILSKIITQIYPTAALHELSPKKIGCLQDELETWSTQLAEHLRLSFEKDKPSTRVVSSQSPLLSLAYHYVHTLVSRPVILAASASVQSQTQSSILSFASSSKRIVQIIQLLEERKMSFSFCLNKNETLLLAGFGLLFQSVELHRTGPLFKDNANLVQAVVTLLLKSPSASAFEFKKMSKSLIREVGRSNASLNRNNPEGATSPRGRNKTASKNPLKALASRLASPANKSTPNLLSSFRRATFSEMMTASQTSLLSTGSDHHELFSTDSITRISARSEPTRSPAILRSSLSPLNKASLPSSESGAPNLDFLTFGHFVVEGSRASLPGPLRVKESADWERILSDMDNGQNTIYDGIYGGSNGATNLPVDLSTPPDVDLIDDASWSPLETWAAGSDLRMTQGNVPQSVLSFESDETLTGGDEWTDIGGLPGGGFDENSTAIVVPEAEESGYAIGTRDMSHLLRLDVGFGL